MIGEDDLRAGTRTDGDTCGAPCAYLVARRCACTPRDRSRLTETEIGKAQDHQGGRRTIEEEWENEEEEKQEKREEKVPRGFIRCDYFFVTHCTPFTPFKTLSKKNNDSNNNDSNDKLKNKEKKIVSLKKKPKRKKY